jgi:threonine aldolase
VDLARVRTNFVVLNLAGTSVDGPTFGALAREHGVFVSVIAPHAARLLTHLDVDDAGLDKAIDVLTKILKG